MPLTPNSSTSPYITGDDVAARVDSRLVGQLLADDGTTVPASSFDANPTLVALMADASGELESACLDGERYAPGDLLDLNGNSLAYMKRILVALTAGYLYQRRGQVDDRVTAQFEWAQDMLGKLRNGDQVFAFVEDESAGVASNSFYTDAELDQLGLMTRGPARRYFGNRAREWRVT